MQNDSEAQQDAGNRRSYEKPLFVKSRVSLQKLTAQVTTSAEVTTTTTTAA
jgi:hypothetical protein